MYYMKKVPFFHLFLSKIYPREFEKEKRMKKYFPRFWPNDKNCLTDL